MFGKFIEKQIEVKDVTFPEQMFQTDIIVLLQQVDIAELCTPTLAGCIRQTIASSCRHPDRIRKTNIMIH